MSLLLDERPRWFLWYPVGMASGIAVYFTLPFEPPYSWTLFLLFSTLFSIYILRHTPWRILFQGILLSFVFGFAAIHLRTAYINAPILDKFLVEHITGRIVSVRLYPDGYRMLLENIVIENHPTKETPFYVHLRVRTRLPSPPPPIGTTVRVRGTLFPPSPPVSPNAFNFQRYAFYQQLGATGLTYSIPQVLEPPSPNISLTTTLHSIRTAIQTSITQVVSEPITAGLIIALMLGEKSSIPPEVLETFYHSGLTHLIVISGLHMTFIAFFTFLMIRSALAALPALALNYPIKKWACLVSICVAFSYMILVGHAIPTIRATLMTTLVMIALLFDRHPFNMRLLAFAAITLLLIRPESLLSFSFQVSFTIVLCLIAFYEKNVTRIKNLFSMAGWKKTVLLYVLSLMITSFLASLVSIPFTMFHFQRMSLVSPLSNLFAVPLMTLLIMPTIMITYIFMLFGLEYTPLMVLNWSMKLLITIAQTAMEPDWASLAVPALSKSVFIFCVLGLLWLCLWRRRWRFLGLLSLLWSIILYNNTPQPQILISDQSNLIAVRTQQNGLSFSRKSKSFVYRTWLQLNGLQESEAPWPKVGWSDDQKMSCDPLGCLYRHNAHVVALIREPDALSEDCHTAHIVITPFENKICSADIVIDPFLLSHHGAHALYLPYGQPPYIQTVRSGLCGPRPWCPKRSF